MEKKIKTLGTLHAGSFHVDLDEVDPGGGLKRRLVIRHPSAVVVVPLLGLDETLVVTQHRYPIARETVEFPAGKLDPGEEPLDAARRELAEETGYQAGIFERLLCFAPSIGYSDEIIHVFTARDLTRLKSPPQDHEISRVEVMKISRVKEMVLSGRLIDGTTILALAVYEWLGRGPSSDG